MAVESAIFFLRNELLQVLVCDSATYVRMRKLVYCVIPVFIGQLTLFYLMSVT